jgi:hypothetical protein
MPDITAQADVFRDWDAVLGACVKNAELIPGIDPLKTELEGFLTQAKDLKIEQETLEGRRRAVTQQLEAAIENGRETTRKIRAFVVVHLGTANQAISQFGVTVRKRRGGKKSKSKSKSPEAQPPAASTAAPSTPNETQSNQDKETQHV